MEILKRNPFSVIFRSLTKDPVKGTQNFIIGPPGIGKTTLLVHLGIYRIFQGYHVVHVSKSIPDKVSFYYESVLLDTLRALPPKELEAQKNMLVQRRTILSFVEGLAKAQDLLNTLENLRSIYYEPCCLLLDNFQEVLFGEAGYLAHLKDRPFEVWATLDGKMEDLRLLKGSKHLLELTQEEGKISVKAYEVEGNSEAVFKERLYLTTSSLLLID